MASPDTNTCSHRCAAKSRAASVHASSRLGRSMPSERPSVRDARADDLERIFEIYNEEVLHGTATFDTEPRVAGRDDAWLTARETRRHPVLVAVAGDDVVGWASLSPWSERGGYARTVEGSVYVDADHRRRGVGAAAARGPHRPGARCRRGSDPRADRRGQRAQRRPVRGLRLHAHRDAAALRREVRAHPRCRADGSSPRRQVRQPARSDQDERGRAVSRTSGGSTGGATAAASARTARR